MTTMFCFQFEDLEKMIEYYESFKKEFSKKTKSSQKQKNGEIVMTVNRKSRGSSPLNEHKMIDIQYVIQKLEADLEFHKTKNSTNQGRIG